MPLVTISHPAIDIDLRYAVAGNITGAPIYDHAEALLHVDAHAALVCAAGRAAVLGLRLRVYDAYRPEAAQWRLWRLLPDPRFVADPRIGSMHTRGIAVDLGLADAAGVPLDMGTGFDDMTPRSSHEATDIGAEALRHRRLLRELMAACGWLHHPHEWWHYNLPDWQRYPLLPDAEPGHRLIDSPRA